MSPRRPPLRSLRWLALLALALGGCTLLPPPGAPPPSVFVLESPDRAAESPAAAGPAIEIAPPTARPGFDGPRIAYVTRPYELQFFARHEWLDAPARMLAPLLADALERGAGLRAFQAGLGAAPALRLETEIAALQQEFTAHPSRVRFELRARLVDVLEHRVVASAAFEAVEPSESEDPYGGVVAANRAVARVLEQLAGWCAENGR
jgi:cholesterol transport system auxiliary component